MSKLETAKEITEKVISTVSDTSLPTSVTAEPDSFSMTLLSQVNSFYHSAFSDLLVLVVTVITMVGVVVPSLLTWLQNRSFKSSQAELSARFNTGILEQKAINIAANDKLETSINDLTKKAEKLESQLEEQANKIEQNLVNNAEQTELKLSQSMEAIKKDVTAHSDKAILELTQQINNNMHETTGKIYKLDAQQSLDKKYYTSAFFIGLLSLRDFSKLLPKREYHSEIQGEFMKRLIEEMPMDILEQELNKDDVSSSFDVWDEVLSALEEKGLPEVSNEMRKAVSIKRNKNKSQM